MLKTVVLLHIFVKTMMFFQDNLMKKVKQQHLLKTEILCTIINLVTATFDQFNAFLMNTSNDIFQKS